MVLVHGKAEVLTETGGKLCSWVCVSARPPWGDGRSGEWKTCGSHCPLPGWSDLVQLTLGFNAAFGAGSTHHVCIPTVRVKHSLAGAANQELILPEVQA